MTRDIGRAVVLAATALVGLWVITAVLFQVGTSPPRLEAVLAWGAIGAGLGLLLSMLRQPRVAAVVALVVTAAALGGRALDVGPLSTIASASFTWVTVGAVIARAGALVFR